MYLNCIFFYSKKTLRNEIKNDIIDLFYNYQINNDIRI